MIINRIRKKDNYSWPLLLIISLSSFATGMFRDGFSALFPFLQKEFDLNRVQLSLHSTILFFFSMFFGLYSGRLIDLKGPKWGLVVGTILLGIFIILHAATPNYFILLILAGFSGLAMSLHIPSANKGIAEWFPQKSRSTIMGIISIGFPIGGILAAALLPIIGILLGWRTAILIPGVFALLCAFSFLIFYQDRRKENDKLEKENSISFRESVYKLIRNNDLRIIAILGFFLGAASGTVATHFALFLYLDHGFTEDIAGRGFAVIQVGSLLGRPGWSFICNRFLKANKRKAFLYIGLIFLVTSLAFSQLFRILNPPICVFFIIAFFSGFSGRGWHGLYFASITEVVKEENIGIAMGFSMFFLRGGIVLIPPIFGYIADLRGSYDLSWFLLGLTIGFTTIFQYHYFKYKSRKEK